MNKHDELWWISTILVVDLKWKDLQISEINLHGFGGGSSIWQAKKRTSPQFLFGWLVRNYSIVQKNFPAMFHPSYLFFWQLCGGFRELVQEKLKLEWSVAVLNESHGVTWRIITILEHIHRIHPTKSNVHMASRFEPWFVDSMIVYIEFSAGLLGDVEWLTQFTLVFMVAGLWTPWGSRKRRNPWRREHGGSERSSVWGLFGLCVTLFSCFKWQEQYFLIDSYFWILRLS